MTGEENLRLIREIEANREFLLMVYRQNPELLVHAEQRIRDLFGLPAEAQYVESFEVKSGKSTLAGR
jgi:hypothetical protein